MQRREGTDKDDVRHKPGRASEHIGAAAEINPKQLLQHDDRERRGECMNSDICTQTPIARAASDSVDEPREQDDKEAEWHRQSERRRAAKDGSG